MTQPFLVYHVVGGKAVCDIAYPDEDGDWQTSLGQQVWPFHVEPFSHVADEIPDGWMNHLEDVAVKWATSRRQPKLDLLALMPKPAPIRRRV